MGDEWNLDALRWHWGDAYLISYKPGGLWLAERKDNGEVLSARDAGELRGRILADYLEHPVSRRLERPDLQGGAEIIRRLDKR